VSTEPVFGERGLALAPDAADAEIDVTRLRVALARLSRRLRRHELAGLTPTQLAALSTIEKTGPMRLGDLAAAEGIAPSTLTRLVTALEEAGYVRRCADPSDARASTLTITAHGQDALERIRSENTLMLTESLELLTPEQRSALAAALPVLEQLAEAQVAPASPASGPARPGAVDGNPLSLIAYRGSRRSSARRRASSSRSLVTAASWCSRSMMRRMACRVMPSSAMETTCWMTRIS
jgi:DNA-binding MarR family transcriptional regulator